MDRKKLLEDMDMLISDYGDMVFTISEEAAKENFSEPMFQLWKAIKEEIFK